MSPNDEKQPRLWLALLTIATALRTPRRVRGWIAWRLWVSAS